MAISNDMSVLKKSRGLAAPIGQWAWSIGLTLVILLGVACQPQPSQIFIEVDGRRQALTTEAATVRDALIEAKVVLEPLDKVKPDLYAQLDPGLVIVVTRVTEEIETLREVIPFERQTVVNEALDPGDTRLAQLGVSGEDEITIRVVYENGEEVSRSETTRKTIIEPQPEILVIGPQGELPSIPLDGTIAYLSNGNAWIMRDTSGSRRALTTAGDLDGRVFSLSADGRRLLFTRTLTDEIELPLNELWLASTTIVGEPPIPLGVQGVLHGAWSPVMTQSVVAFSTADRTANSPGWQANNDLWLLNISGDLEKTKPEPVELLPPNTQGLYPWWGTTFTWSPDGTQLAYARADQVGLINLALTQTLTLSDGLTSLVDFVPVQTFSEWVWVPGISWSPDGRFIAATVHGPPLASEPAEESQVFDLWLLSTDGTIAAKAIDQVGMWANPKWGAAGIAFGQAIDPRHSVNSRYTIQLIDRDGSNQRQLFPLFNETGVQLPSFTWSPDDQHLLFVYDGDLYITNNKGSPPRQLTTETQASQPQWAAHIVSMVTNRPTESITETVSISTTPALTRPLRTTSSPTLTTTPKPSAVITTPTSADIEELPKGNE